MSKTKHKSVSYTKWGYFFIAPFFITFIVCTLVPLILTFYYSFFSYQEPLDPLGAATFEFVGVQNFVNMFTPNAVGTVEVLRCTWNTIIMWAMGAVPQFIFALLLAVIFTGSRLRIKAQGFFKTVIYMPNLIMASSFAMLFFVLFSNVGPINSFIVSLGGDKVDFFNSNPIYAQGLVAFINFIMWFGNTTILLMAGIMGIDTSLFEAASIDGAKSHQVLFKVTLPLLKPILIYVAITALIGGLQMFDVPQTLTRGNPANSTKTLIMMLNNYLAGAKNYGDASAVSIYIFLITGILSLIVFRILVPSKKKQMKEGK